MRVPVVLWVIGCGIALMLSCATHTQMPPADWVYAAVRSPPEYSLWWREMEDCLGKRRDFEDIAWFVVKGDEHDGSFKVNGKGNKIGYAFVQPGFVFLSNRYYLDHRVVKHEAYHMISGMGDEGHNRSAFLRCVPAFGG